MQQCANTKVYAGQYTYNQISKLFALIRGTVIRGMLMIPKGKQNKKKISTD